MLSWKVEERLKESAEKEPWTVEATNQVLFVGITLYISELENN
jgi:hypothetical protein